jgi:ubiquinone/menaquinone biosynthesis C-methylase UbiE
MIYKQKCILCGSNSHSEQLEINSYKIVKCKRCQFVFTKPLPTLDDVLPLYNKVSSVEDVGKIKRMRRNFKHRLFAATNIKRYLRDINKINLLEIGCNQGDFLNSIKNDTTFTLLGIDIDKNALNYAEKRLGLNVKYGTLESFEFNDNTFDCVLALQVIEHLIDPILQEIYRILKPGGLFIAAVPCVSHIKAVLNGTKWKYYGPPGHLWYFSKKTFALYLKKFNFEILFSSCFYLHAHLKVIARKI